MTSTQATPRSDTAARADVAVIGGTGFYSFLTDPEEVRVETPYGDPSAPIAIGTVAGRRVAFVPRHGTHHDFPPHAIPARANLWALRSLGVRQVLAPCANCAAPSSSRTNSSLASCSSSRTLPQVAWLPFRASSRAALV